MVTYFHEIIGTLKLQGMAGIYLDSCVTNFYTQGEGIW